MARQSGLGKGLSSLIPSGGSISSSQETVSITEIKPNGYQPRGRFDEEELASLADSIRELGILQPLLVRPCEQGFELIAGERRLRAAKRVGLREVPIMVRESDDVWALEAALVENIHREDLNALEVATAYKQLVEEFGLTHDEVAKRVGKSRASVTNMIRLLQLPQAVQKRVRDCQITMGHARALLGTPDRSLQESIAERVFKEDLSVRSVEELIKQGACEKVLVLEDFTSQKLKAPGLLQLEELLADLLETRVKVSTSKNKGQIRVEFSDLEDLERIYRIMATSASTTS